MSKYSDLYEIVNPSLNLTFLFAHWCGMRERSRIQFNSHYFSSKGYLLSLLKLIPPIKTTLGESTVHKMPLKTVENRLHEEQ